MTDPTDDCAPSTPLLFSSRPLAQAYDVALLDLDGVCFAGEVRIPHAAEGANGARALGMGLSFITNNASRAPQTVVDKLAANDIEAFAREVFTAAMDAAALLRERLDPGARVLVVGRDGSGRGRGRSGAHPQLPGAPTTRSSGTSGAMPASRLSQTAQASAR